MKVKNVKILKNGRIAGFIKQKDGSWKWRFLQKGSGGTQSKSKIPTITISSTNELDMSNFSIYLNNILTHTTDEVLHNIIHASNITSLEIFKEKLNEIIVNLENEADGNPVYIQINKIKPPIEIVCNVPLIKEFKSQLEFITQSLQELSSDSEGNGGGASANIKTITITLKPEIAKTFYDYLENILNTLPNDSYNMFMSLSVFPNDLKIFKQKLDEIIANLENDCHNYVYVQINQIKPPVKIFCNDPIIQKFKDQLGFINGFLETCSTCRKKNIITKNIITKNTKNIYMGDPVTVTGSFGYSILEKDDDMITFIIKQFRRNKNIINSFFAPVYSENNITKFENLIKARKNTRYLENEESQLTINSLSDLTIDSLKTLATSNQFNEFPLYPLGSPNSAIESFSESMLIYSYIKTKHEEYITALIKFDDIQSYILIEILITDLFIKSNISHVKFLLRILCEKYKKDLVLMAIPHNYLYYIEMGFKKKNRYYFIYYYDKHINYSSKSSNQTQSNMKTRLIKDKYISSKDIPTGEIKVYSPPNRGHLIFSL